MKKMFKVISPVVRSDGKTWWMRCGNALPNKDESINVYLDALPLAALTSGKSLTLQLREYTEEEMRERAERSQRPPGAFAPRSPNGLAYVGPPGAGAGGPAAAGDIPF